MASLFLLAVPEQSLVQGLDQRYPWKWRGPAKEGGLQTFSKLQSLVDRPQHLSETYPSDSVYFGRSHPTAAVQPPVQTASLTGVLEPQLPTTLPGRQIRTCFKR